MKKTILLTLMVGGFISSLYSRTEEVKGLAGMLGEHPELAQRLIYKINRCKQAKQENSIQDENRYCDFDPVLLEGSKGNGKSMLRDAIAHDTGSVPHVLLAVQMTEGGIDALNDQLAFVAQCAEADDGVALFVFEEVEEFTHGQQSLIKEVLDDKEYKDKIQFILTSNRVEGVRDDVINRCGGSIHSMYNPEKNERRAYLEGFGEKHGVSYHKAQLDVMRYEIGQCNIRNLENLVKVLAEKHEWDITNIADADLKKSIKDFVEQQGKAEEQGPGFLGRHKTALGWGGSAGSLAVGLYAEPIRNGINYVAKGAFKGVVYGVKNAPGAVVYVWHWAHG